MGAEDQIHDPVGFFQLFRHVGLLHHAAADRDDLVGVALLGVVQCAHIPQHPLLRVLSDGAGVEDHHVGLLGIHGEAEAHGV